MRFLERLRYVAVGMAVLGCLFSSADRARASAGVEIYSTGFEASEGYDINFNLAGQQGWLSAEGPAGIFDGRFPNGLVTNVFPTSDQQAYIGFDPPDTNAFIFVWQPINLDPVPADTPVIQFEVAFAIFDSTTADFDNFTFEVFNTRGDSLLAIDFDNFALEVRYALNRDTNFTSTGIFFENAVIYTLTLTLDFEFNVWSASFRDAENEFLITESQRISNGDPLNFGDVSVLWFNAAGFALGDNLMVFDDYRITAFPKPQVEWRGFTTGGDARIRLFGETGSDYAIEVGDSADQWAPVFTNTVTDTFFDYTDTDAAALDMRFYRGRLVQ